MKSTAPRRKRIRGKGWKKQSTISGEKYEVISKAILASLTRTPIKFSRLVELVNGKVKRFSGSVGWYTISCLRELEVQRKVKRHLKPVLYSKT